MRYSRRRHQNDRWGQNIAYDEGAQKDSFEVDWHDSFLLMGFAF
jgi:hypothetical protein